MPGRAPLAQQRPRTRIRQDTAGARSGAELLALDAVGARPGDVVLVVGEGWGASTAATGRPQAAIDSAIVAVVDHVDLDTV